MEYGGTVAAPIVDSSSSVLPAKPCTTVTLTMRTEASKIGVIRKRQWKIGTISSKFLILFILYLHCNLCRRNRPIWSSNIILCSSLQAVSHLLELSLLLSSLAGALLYVSSDSGVYDRLVHPPWAARSHSWSRDDDAVSHCRESLGDGDRSDL